METIYESEFATIYCGDARHYAADAEPSIADTLVTDPPYGVNFKSGYSQNFDETMTGDDDREAVINALATTARALKRMRHVYVFGYSPSDLVEPLRLSNPVELIWDRGVRGMGDLTSSWSTAHEHITFGVYVPSPAERADQRGSLSARLRKGSILRAYRKTGRAHNRHPTEKPVELMRQLIESSSCIGETVLDPFAGSGSTLVAAIVSGRRCIGVEIDEKYARIAVQRVKAAERVYGQIAGL